MNLVSNMRSIINKSIRVSHFYKSKVLINFRIYIKNTNNQKKMEVESSSIQNHFPTKMICLNPFCQQGQSRVTDQSKQKIQQLHKYCKGWSLNIEDFQKQQKSIQNKPNIVNYSNQAIKSLIDLYKLYDNGSMNQQMNNEINSQKLFSLEQNDPLRHLQYNFYHIKQKVEQDLQRTFEEIQQNIKLIQKLHIKTMQQLKQISQIENEQQMNKKINSSQILQQYGQYVRDINQLVIINDKRALKEIQKISNSIKNLSHCFWSPKLQSKKRQEQILQKVYKKIDQDQKNLLNNSQIHPSIKVQELANTFNAGSIQPNYANQKQNIYLRCWICGKNCQAQGKSIKQRKNLAYQQLLNHLLIDHKQQIKYKQIKQSLNCLSHKITFKQMLQEIEDKVYQKFVIIDKENIGKMNFLNQMDNNTYCLSVVSPQTQNIANGRYIVADSIKKDAADTLIVLIIYAITQSGFYQSKKYTNKQIFLYTKDHFGQSLKQILAKIGIQIEIIQ